jgi:hypothetical protein
MIEVKVYRVNKAKPLVYMAETEESANQFIAGVVEHGFTFLSEGKSVYWPPHAIVEVTRVYTPEKEKGA